MSYSLGIDIGGTFTDIVVYDQARGRQLKPQGPDHPRRPGTGRRRRASRASCASTACRRPTSPGSSTPPRSSPTPSSSASGAVTGLLTTAGFADTLEIGRERKFELYDLNIAKPEPLVPRHFRLEVAERVRADGAVVRTLDARAGGDPGAAGWWTPA